MFDQRVGNLSSGRAEDFARPDGRVSEHNPEVNCRFSGSVFAHAVPHSNNFRTKFTHGAVDLRVDFRLRYKLSRYEGHTWILPRRAGRYSSSEAAKKNGSSTAVSPERRSRGRLGNCTLAFETEKHGAGAAVFGDERRGAAVIAIVRSRGVSG
jgi:hypothetical protein